MAITTEAPVQSGATVTMPLAGPGGVTYGPFSQTWATSCPTVTITPTSLPAPVSGVPYSAMLSATPAGPYTFSISFGSVPTGLSLSGDGTLSGTPTAPGTYAFTVTANDTQSSCSGNQAYVLTVAFPALRAPPPSEP